MREDSARVLAVLICVVAVGIQVQADEIVLRGSVRLPRDANVVRMRDIAELTGPLAIKHADVVIGEAPASDRPIEIEVRHVRAALDQAGVHWGKLQLNGSRVIVRPAQRPAAQPPLAMSGARISAEAAPTPPRHSESRRTQREYQAATELVDRDTTRGAIARLLAESLRVDPRKLRLSFDDQDQEFLDGSLQGVRLEVQPLSSLNTDRVELRTRIWSQGRIQTERSLAVHPRLYREVLTLSGDVKRGGPITEDLVDIEPQWLSPSQANRTASLIEAVGRTAARRLRSGERLHENDLKSEEVISRGDRVVVRCVAGGVVISMEADARTGGAVGQTILLRKIGEREEFSATVTGPGAAIVDLAR